MRNVQAETVVQLKSCMASARTLCIIISKFGHRKEISLIIFFIIDKCLKIDLYSAVRSFDQVIGLLVKSGKESLLNFRKVTE